MPVVASRDYRASWEIPYDFRPRIHAYPGSRSAARSCMGARSPTSAASNAATAPRHQRVKRTLRRYCLAPRAATATPAVAAPGDDQGAAQATTSSAAGSPRKSAAVAPQKPQCPSLPQQQRQPKRCTGRCAGQTSHATPILSAVNGDGDAGASPAGLVAPTPPLHTAAKARSGERGISAPSAALHQGRSHASPLFTRCSVPQRPISTTVGVARRLLASRPTEHCGRGSGAQPPSSSSITAPVPPVPAPSAPPPSAPAATAAAAHTGYHHRTKPHYSLRPSYAAHSAQWWRSPVPTIRVADRYRSPPAAREYRLRARQVRHASREDFVEALRSCMASGGQEVVPDGVVGALTDTRDAGSFDPSLHNYNVMVTDTFQNSIEERAARLQATENRMWERIILNVAPLAVAHQHVAEVGGWSVLDSGHVSSPIRISSAPEAAYVDDGVAEVDEAMAVVVRPFSDELLGDSEALRVAEAQRRWPKGREWDRQAAIQRAVGSTAQEAIIDLGIDPRYRQPGERPGCVSNRRA
ncbi:hypothetical protein LdCL_040015300 [Leishmania donovani]|uniref:Uncharacterized protein n=1 Tax=Leishmania donovani TaxID=5661 RepID=A0A3S5H5D8_LEIDO|nr:hypothetical protein LdCL_040015300 [Leishmania donovani]